MVHFPQVSCLSPVSNGGFLVEWFGIKVRCSVCFECRKFIEVPLIGSIELLLFRRLSLRLSRPVLLKWYGSTIIKTTNFQNSRSHWLQIQGLTGISMSAGIVDSRPYPITTYACRLSLLHCALTITGITFKPLDDGLHSVLETQATTSFSVEPGVKVLHSSLSFIPPRASMQDQCQPSALSLPLHIYESIFESMFSFEFHEGFLNDAWFFEYFFALQSCSRITPPLFLWLRDDPETGSLRCFLYTLCTGDVWLLYCFQYCFMLILIRFFMVAEERWIQGCFSWLDIDSISSWGACEWWSLISSIFIYLVISTLPHFFTCNPDSLF